MSICCTQKHHLDPRVMVGRAGDLQRLADIMSGDDVASAMTAEEEEGRSTLWRYEAAALAYLMQTEVLLGHDDSQQVSLC